MLDLSDRNVIRVKIERILANINCMSVIESVAVLSTLRGSTYLWTFKSPLSLF